MSLASPDYPGCRQPLISMVSCCSKGLYYTISVSKIRWKNDGLGLEWLQAVFEPLTSENVCDKGN